MRLLFLAPACLLAASCTATTVAPAPVTGITPTPIAAAPAAVQADPLKSLADFTIADLQAASADAKAQTPPDTTAAQCYDFLIITIPTLKAAGSATGTVGAILVFQKARDLASGTINPNGLLKQLNLACAPLVIDAQTVVNRLLLIGAGTAASGGTLGPLLQAIPLR